MDELPPCKVCGGRSSGLHYGVMTCESCKGFFRRAFIRKSPYECKLQQDCHITEKTRKCFGCRLRKCSEVGMSVDAIQMGRVTINDKADRLIEYKDRQEQQRKQTIHTTNQIVVLSNELLQHGSSEDKLSDETNRDPIIVKPKSDDQTQSPHLIFENQETLLTLGDDESQNVTAIPTHLNGIECGTTLQKIKHPMADTNLVFGAENSSHHSCFQGHESSLPGERDKVHLSATTILSHLCKNTIYSSDCDESKTIQHVKNYINHHNGDVESMKKEWLNVGGEDCGDDCIFKNLEHRLSQEVELSEDTCTDIDGIVSSLTHAMDCIQIFSVKYSADEVKQKLKKGSEEFKVKQEVFGELRRLPDRDYYNLYKTTRIDADGRMKQIDDLFSWYAVIVHQYIDFAKSIPGFCSLLTCDQAALLKASRTECFFFIIHVACDPDTEMVMLFSGQTYNIKEIVGWMPEELLKVWTEFCKGIQNLNLTKKEQALVLALLITTPNSDKYTLKEPEKVQEIRKKLELSIEHVVQGTEKNSTALWIQMTRNLISSIQSMKDIEETEHNSVCQMPSIVNFLLNE
ncbi:vitamin D3 receptor A-like [Mytilus californianus]|uniref:vitamin D3 receptor A-like n=1 Tax=Mytilus californianus TaxID=6549 RepID=UPI002246DEFB|nr:vitamin D3 receptor A-like [Mytilus californianus]XP_052064872.1 vitamin D3 receptor A-like [Mytilus californianus]XP_052064873.1 vitamin D3 receptor A-like [Mytilus californianus]